MLSSQKLSKATSRGLLSQLSQAKLLFQGLKNQSVSNENQELSKIKSILLNKVSPFIENQKMVPGLSAGLRTVLSQVSDKEIVDFLSELEILIGDALDEMVEPTTADLDIRDHNLNQVNTK